MGSGQLSGVVRHIRKLAGMPGSSNQTDAQLLERFTVEQDEAAFETLLQRHGPMVLGVCRRLLANPHDAEDAFQATFLVLVCKAGSIAKRESAGSWLHGVAHRIAARARARAEHEHQRLKPLPNLMDAACIDVPAEAERRELCAALEEELNRLPEKHKAPLVLCYLEGKSRQEAAQQLCWPEGTVQRRLARGRELLHSRLVRRGMTLSAALAAAGLSTNGAPAAVPAALVAATIKAAFLIAAGKGATAGAMSAQAAALTKAALHALFLTKLKIASAVMLIIGVAGLGIGTATQQVLAQRQNEAAAKAERSRASSAKVASKRSAEPDKTAHATPSVPSNLEETKTMTVGGRVMDANGKPVANADVAVLGRPKDALRSPRGDGQPGEALGQGKTDREGRFRLTVRLISKEHYRAVSVFARAPGHALGWQDIDADLDQAVAEIRLPRERILQGRLIDLQGQAAANVKLHVVRIVGPPPQRYRPLLKADRPQGGLACLPEPATTDANGHFVLRGLDGTLSVSVELQDNRFGPQELEIPPREPNDRAEISFVLKPARVLEGTVIEWDTGKPMPNARLVVQTHPRIQEYDRIYQAETQADEQGRFRVVLHAGSSGSSDAARGPARMPALLPPPPANSFTVRVYPPAGVPYLPVWMGFDWPRADVIKHTIPVALPRGVVVLGTVTEGASGKPVPGARIEFSQPRVNNPFYRRDVEPQAGKSGPDGTFQLTILPGPGHLLINGPNLDYLHVETTWRELFADKNNPNRRYYPDALVSLNLKPDSDPQRVAVMLHRGVTLSGRVVGPDNQLVAHAEMICRSFIPYGYTLNPVHHKEIMNGRFELPGCDPEKPTEVFFFDAKHQLGAVARLSGREAGKSVTVVLQPYGSATARLVTENGQPARDFQVFAEFVITPGVYVGDFWPPSQAPNIQAPAADTTARWSHDAAGNTDFFSDAQGRVTLPSLIPGATYWLIGARGLVNLHKEFKVEPGKTFDLGDIAIPPGKGNGS